MAPKRKTHHDADRRYALAALELLAIADEVIE